jgi:hypothetical protein
LIVGSQQRNFCSSDNAAREIGDANSQRTGLRPNRNAANSTIPARGRQPFTGLF